MFTLVSSQKSLPPNISAASAVLSTNQSLEPQVEEKLTRYMCQLKALGGNSFAYVKTNP
jgi:hypothetical protein